jgi:hypothetical protein
MVDGSDGLPDHVRRRAWEALNQFIMENSRHEYILAVGPTTLATGGLFISDVLVMQLISRRNLQRFLTQTLKDPAGPALYAALERAHAFDLAAMPWLLFEMLKQTQQGAPPQSRGQVFARHRDRPDCGNSPRSRDARQGYRDAHRAGVENANATANRLSGE